MQDIETRLEQIGRKFVHRRTTGYKHFSQVMQDMDEVASALSAKADQSEIWLRIANDISEYLTDWRDQLDEEDVEISLKVIGNFEGLLLANKQIFTVTQEIRLKSIAQRTRQSWSSNVDPIDWKDVYLKLLDQTIVE